MKAFLGIASLVTAGAAGVAAAVAHRPRGDGPEGQPDAGSALAGDPVQAIDAARDRLRAAAASGAPGTRAA